MGEVNDMECPVCDFFRRIATFSDTHAILAAILSEARNMAHADAGTIYLLEGSELVFSAAQNETLFPSSAANKFFYMNSRVPADKSSIAGYVAVTGQSLNIPDAHVIPAECEYGFNGSFDEKTGYRTVSVLAIPLTGTDGVVKGVLQLINSLKNGRPCPFSDEMCAAVSRLGLMATIPLERSFLITDMILRMLRTSALRDPRETGAHVRRVGSMAAELFHSWAASRDMDPEELLAAKGRLRLAAMLHDVGKVGIPDAVLQKPGRLDDEERAIMQTHSALGAGLFDGSANDIDILAREIALHHHAKWNGEGYTGSPDIPSPAGEDIPLGARITAIADVYDALVSKRCYKEAWDASKALEILQKDAGSHFDPELVEHFLEIQDVVKAIFERYGE